MRPRFDGGHHEHFFPCDCGDWHYIGVSVDDEDPDWQYLMVDDAYWPHRWRDRLRAAAKVLRGRPHYHSGVVLDEANTLDLKRVVDALAVRYETREDQ